MVCGVLMAKKKGKGIKKGDRMHPEKEIAKLTVYKDTYDWAKKLSDAEPEGAQCDWFDKMFREVIKNEWEAMLKSEMAKITGEINPSTKKPRGRHGQ